MEDGANNQKGFFSRALQKTKEKIKVLENSLRKRDLKIDEFQKTINNLEKDNKNLKDELDAKNRKKPPIWARTNKARTKPQKKKGPKVGHPCNPRKIPEKIDQEIVVIPEQCPECNNSDIAFPSKWHEHTQLDIPAFSDVITTRFVVGWSYCNDCGKQVCRHQKLKYSKYGPNLHAYVSYLKFKLGMTLGKISNLLLEQYKLELSTGQISELLKRCKDKFEEEYKAIGRKLKDQNHLHADETGWRSDGISKWLWSFANDDLSFYVIKDGRGQNVVNEVLGESFNGVLISDFYGAYSKIECIKQKCWVHLLRDVKKLKEAYPKSKEVEYFGLKLKNFYDRAKMLQGKFNRGKLGNKAYEKLLTQTQNFALKKYRKKELKTLAKRIIKYRNELYTFIKTGVSSDNNFAEREIRPAVLMRKTSYGNRSKQGEKTQAVLMSIIATASKQNQRYTEYCANYLVSR